MPVEFTGRLDSNGTEWITYGWGTTTASLPGQATWHTYSFSLANWTSNPDYSTSAYFGITAATGGSTSNQWVRNVEFDQTSGGGTPEPATWVLLLSALPAARLVRRRRRR